MPSDQDIQEFENSGNGADLASIFKGGVQKLQIVSNNICYGPCPQPDDEVEQHLSITADGSVVFSAYVCGNGKGYRKSRSEGFKIDASKARHMLNLVGNYFSGEYDASFATDVGEWKMTLTNEESKAYYFRGSLCSGCANALNDISNTIRLNLDMPELLVFDGCSNSDRIERISVSYHRVTKIKPRVLPEGATWQYATWDYSEQFIIDRKTETLENNQSIASGCRVSKKYYVEDGILSLLDDFDAETFFAHTEGNPPDIICNPLETRDYRITVDYLHGNQRVLTGSFDKHGLPDDFSDFTETVFHFMRFYGMGEILNPSVYDKALRRQSDFIFCNVQFDEYGKTYCYLTDDDTLEIEDYVIVPVGKENRESVARIESIEYHPAEEAPFPMDRIKKIIRKAHRTEDSDDAIALPEGTVIMGSEPLVGITADTWRAKFGKNCTDEALAIALAGAWNKSGWLGHDLDDDVCTPEIEAAYKEWSALQEELIHEVALRLNCRCEPPYIKLVTPFMTQNGYHDGGGWWIKRSNRDITMIAAIPRPRMCLPRQKMSVWKSSRHSRNPAVG